MCDASSMLCASTGGTALVRYPHSLTHRSSSNQQPTLCRPLLPLSSTSYPTHSPRCENTPHTHLPRCENTALMDSTAFLVSSPYLSSAALRLTSSFSLFSLMRPSASDSAFSLWICFCRSAAYCSAARRSAWICCSMRRRSASWRAVASSCRSHGQRGREGVHMWRERVQE